MNADNNRQQQQYKEQAELTETLSKIQETTGLIIEMDQEYFSTKKEPFQMQTKVKKAVNQQRQSEYEPADMQKKQAKNNIKELASQKSPRLPQRNRQTTRDSNKQTQSSYNITTTRTSCPQIRQDEELDTYQTDLTYNKYNAKMRMGHMQPQVPQKQVAKPTQNNVMKGRTTEQLNQRALYKQPLDDDLTWSRTTMQAKKSNSIFKNDKPAPRQSSLNPRNNSTSNQRRRGDNNLQSSGRGKSRGDSMTRLSDLEQNNNDVNQQEQSFITFQILHSELINLKKRIHSQTGFKVQLEQLNKETGQKTTSDTLLNSTDMIACSAIAQNLINSGEKVIFSHDLLADRKENEFTVFFVKIITQMGSWNIVFRYSQLHNLHKQLSKKYKELADSKQFPIFPPKSWWWNKNEKFTQQRKVQLQQYLYQLNGTIDLLKDNELCTFFHFPHSTQLLLKDLQQRELKQKEQTDRLSIRSMSPDLILGPKVTQQNIGNLNRPYSTKAQPRNQNRLSNQADEQDLQLLLSPEQALRRELKQKQSFKDMQDSNNWKAEQIISYFFQQVHEQPLDKQLNIKKLEKYYFDVKPRLNSIVLKQLIFGSLDQESISRKVVGAGPTLFEQSLQGLLVLMSEGETLSAISATHLLSKMLDFERNIHADACARELARASPEFLSLFNFERLINNTASRKAVLHILKVYIERRKSLSETDQLVNEVLKTNKTRLELLAHLNGGKTNLKQHQYQQKNHLEPLKNQSTQSQNSNQLSVGSVHHQQQQIVQLNKQTSNYRTGSGFNQQTNSSVASMQSYQPKASNNTSGSGSVSQFLKQTRRNQSSQKQQILASKTNSSSGAATTNQEDMLQIKDVADAGTQCFSFDIKDDIHMRKKLTGEVKSELNVRKQVSESESATQQPKLNVNQLKKQ